MPRLSNRCKIYVIYYPICRAAKPDRQGLLGLLKPIQTLLEQLSTFCLDPVTVLSLLIQSNDAILPDVPSNVPISSTRNLLTPWEASNVRVLIHFIVTRTRSLAAWSCSLSSSSSTFQFLEALVSPVFVVRRAPIVV
jgi:hypothetical protein